MENKVRIGLPDGNGAFGNIDFWKEYFELIGVEYVDCDTDLQKFVEMSNKVFPSAICLNSKYRLGRALTMANDVDYFMFFLREDSVANCLASIYRAEWVREYFKADIKTIIWKKDLMPGKSDEENLKYLSKVLTGKSNEEILKDIKIPERLQVYDYSLRRKCKNKKTIMIIGVAPFFVDPYRKSELMDYITSRVNVLNPISLLGKNETFEEDREKLYKENAIIRSIEKGYAHKVIDGVLFVGDAFDLPGKYTFPKIKKYINDNTKLKILDVTIGINNQEMIKAIFDDFIDKL